MSAVAFVKRPEVASLHEYEVTLTTGVAYVYADCWVHLDQYQFCRGDVVVQQFDDCLVISVKENW
jgi:hypothetical protein